MAHPETAHPDDDDHPDLIPVAVRSPGVHPAGTVQTGSTDVTTVIPEPGQPSVMGVDIDETTLTQRVVLVGVASLAGTGGTPAHAGEIRRVCTDRLDAVEAEAVGTLSEAAVARALKELDAEGLLSSARDDTSATGKGRPRYDLAVQRAELVAALEGDDRLDPLLADVTA